MMLIERKVPKEISYEGQRVDLFGWRKFEVLSENQLNELRNYEPTLIDVTSDYNKPEGLEDFKIQKNESGQHIISYKENGAYEIHHADQDENSGAILTSINGNKGPNTKFVAMMMKQATNLTSQGHTVRIVAKEDMLKKYHKFANKIKEKDGLHNISISDVQLHKAEYNRKEDAYEQLHKFYLIPSTISEAIRILSKGK